MCVSRMQMSTNAPFAKKCSGAVQNDSKTRASRFLTRRGCVLLQRALCGVAICELELLAIEDLAHLARKQQRRVRLLQERDGVPEQALPYGGVVHVPAHEQRLEMRQALAQLDDELGAAEIRQHAIGQDQIDKSLVLLRKLQGLCAVARRQHAIAVKRQTCLCDFAHVFVVLDEQNR